MIFLVMRLLWRLMIMMLMLLIVVICIYEIRPVGCTWMLWLLIIEFWYTVVSNIVVNGYPMTLSSHSIACTFSQPTYDIAELRMFLAAATLLGRDPGAHKKQFKYNSLMCFVHCVMHFCLVCVNLKVCVSSFIGSRISYVHIYRIIHC